MNKHNIIVSLLIAGGLVSPIAHATNGYFAHGYGMKAKGMAGASTASSDDAFFGANNPAAAAFAGDRVDLGVDVFSPIREASDTNFGGAFGPVTSESDSNYFLIPEFGYNKMVNPNLALGVTVYGNGGMNTNYPALAGFGGMNILGGTGSLGVDLMQLIIAPTAAFKVAPNHSIGVSPLLGYQRFAAEGLQGFGVDSDGHQGPGNPQTGNNLGYDNAFGYGVRVGYMGKIAPTVTIGAAYASKMSFEEFSKYAGLFAEQGDFDIPENYNLGVAWQTTPAVQLALDYQRINYSDVASVGNPVMPNFGIAPLGADNGAGFGWDDINVWKLGMEYKYSPKMTLRAGYSHTDSPIKAGDCSTMTNCGEVMFNILAPAVIEKHATLGFTYTLASGNEMTMAYMHAFENDVSGVNPLSGSTNTIKMYQNSLGFQYSWKM